MATTRIVELLRALAGHGVDHVVVGSAAAILHGAGYTTEDLDVVPSFERGNLTRLLDALEDLDARYADAAGRTIRPDETRLRANRLNLLVTHAGRLDILRSIGTGLDYEALVARSELFPVEELEVRVVDLPTLIEAKEQAGREKDRYHLLFLRETLRLKRLKDGE